MTNQERQTGLDVSFDPYETAINGPKEDAWKHVRDRSELYVSPERKVTEIHSPETIAVDAFKRNRAELRRQL